MVATSLGHVLIVFWKLQEYCPCYILSQCEEEARGRERGEWILQSCFFRVWLMRKPWFVIEWTMWRTLNAVPSSPWPFNDFLVHGKTQYVVMSELQIMVRLLCSFDRGFWIVDERVNCTLWFKCNNELLLAAEVFNCYVCGKEKEKPKDTLGWGPWLSGRTIFFLCKRFQIQSSVFQNKEEVPSTWDPGELQMR